MKEQPQKLSIISIYLFNKQLAYAVIFASSFLVETGPKRRSRLTVIKTKQWHDFLALCISQSTYH